MSELGFPQSSASSLQAFSPRQWCHLTPVCLCYYFRALDALFNFLLVWYYCTLTIRESILITNGSRSVAGSLLWSPMPFMKDFTVDKRLSIHIVAVLETWEADAVVPRVLSGSKAGGSSITMCPPSCPASCSPGQFTSFFLQKSPSANRLASNLSRFCSHRPEGVLYQMFRNQFISYCLYQSKEPLQPSLRIKLCVFCQQDTDWFMLYF